MASTRCERERERERRRDRGRERGRERVERDKDRERELNQVCLLPAPRSYRERVIHRQPTGPNPLHYRDNFGRPALRHGIFDSLFQVA